MNQQLGCEIVKDLLPNYIENLTSEETSQCIKEHLSTCEECRNYYNNMKEAIPVKHVSEAIPFKNYLSKIKITYVLSGLVSVGMISILICFLVNFILEGRLSWSLIVFGGVTFSYAVIYTFLKSKKNKIIKAMGCITVLIIPFLGLIQFTIYHFLDKQQPVWFWNKGIPITIIWLITVWLTIIISKIFKLNYLYIISLLILLSIPGNIITNLITNEYTGLFEIILWNSVSGIGTLGIAMIVLHFGAKWEKRKK